MATLTKVGDDTNTSDNKVNFPDHTCIIKVSMRYKNKKIGTIQSQLQPPVRSMVRR